MLNSNEASDANGGNTAPPGAVANTVVTENKHESTPAPVAHPAHHHPPTAPPVPPYPPGLVHPRSAPFSLPGVYGQQQNIANFASTHANRSAGAHVSHYAQNASGYASNGSGYAPNTTEYRPISSAMPPNPPDTALYAGSGHTVNAPGHGPQPPLGGYPHTHPPPHHPSMPVRPEIINYQGRVYTVMPQLHDQNTAPAGQSSLPPPSHLPQQDIGFKSASAISFVRQELASAGHPEAGVDARSSSLVDASAPARAPATAPAVAVKSEPAEPHLFLGGRRRNRIESPIDEEPSADELPSVPIQLPKITREEIEQAEWESLAIPPGPRHPGTPARSYKLSLPSRDRAKSVIVSPSPTKTGDPRRGGSTAPPIHPLLRPPGSPLQHLPFRLLATPPPPPSTPPPSILQQSSTQNKGRAPSRGPSIATSPNTRSSSAPYHDDDDAQIDELIEETLGDDDTCSTYKNGRPTAEERAIIDAAAQKIFDHAVETCTSINRPLDFLITALNKLVNGKVTYKVGMWAKYASWFFANIDAEKARLGDAYSHVTKRMLCNGIFD